MQSQSWSQKSYLFQTTHGDIAPNKIIKLIRLAAFYTYQEPLLKGNWNPWDNKSDETDDLSEMIKHYRKEISKPLTYTINTFLKGLNCALNMEIQTRYFNT